MGRIKTIELLETIQSAYLKYSPRFREKYIGEHFHELDEKAQKIHSVFPSVLVHIDKIRELDIPSKFQDSFSYLDIYEIFEHIEEVKSLFDVEPFKSKLVNLEKEIPVFGTIPLNRFTALVTSKKEDADEIIIISDGLIDFAMALCSFIAEFFPVYPDKPLMIDDLLVSEEYIKEVIVKRNLREQFYLLIMSYYYTKSCKGLHTMSDNTIAMTEILVEGFLHFTVAHEYCHYLLGHTKKTENAPAFGSDAVLSIKSFNDELEADLFGAMFAEAVITKNRTIYPLSTFGITVCLRAFEIFERLNTLNNIKDDSHPDYLSRRNNLHNFVVRCEIDFFAPIDYIIDLFMQDFDSIVKSIISHMGDKDFGEEELKTYIKEFLK